MNDIQSSQKDENRAVIISGDNLSKFFGGLAALNQVDFQLHENEILGLIGPNGAGKTTLFNLIAGVYKPDVGTISFRGDHIVGLRQDLICRKGIARTFQTPKPFLEISALENGLVGSYFGSHKNLSLKECQKQVDDILLFVGLAHKRDTLASQLTLVERKRLEFTRALSTEPSVLLLDEVIAGLNPTETEKMMNLIKKVRESGISIIMIEHVMKAVMGVSDRVIVLNHGQKIAEGTPEDIVRNPEVIQAYLGGLNHAFSD